MAQLGDIFSDSEGEIGGPRGPNLKVRVSVPRAGLGDPDGAAVTIGRDHVLGSRRIERVLKPEAGDAETTVRLRLPEAFASGSVVRVRGQGGRWTGEGPGRAGDLLVEVTLDGPAPRQRAWLLVLVLGGLALAGGAAAAWWGG